MITVERSCYKSFEVQDENGENLRIDEGMSIKFVVEQTGEVVKGILNKISGKEDNTKLQIIPYETQKEEIWRVDVMADDSLEIDRG